MDWFIAVNACDVCERDREGEAKCRENSKIFDVKNGLMCQEWRANIWAALQKINATDLGE